MHITGKRFEVVVRLLGAQVARAQNVLDLAWHLWACWDMTHQLSEELQLLPISYQQYKTSSPPNHVYDNMYTQFTSSFLNWGGKEWALWGMWKSPITSTSCNGRQGRHQS